jgi:hypothetical protein
LITLEEEAKDRFKEVSTFFFATKDPYFLGKVGGK